MAASAHLELLFGAVYVDPRNRSVTPIDGVRVESVIWSEKTISLSLSSSLSSLRFPYSGPREITVMVERSENPAEITINDQTFSVQSGKGKESLICIL